MEAPDWGRFIMMGKKSRLISLRHSRQGWAQRLHRGIPHRILSRWQVGSGAVSVSQAEEQYVDDSQVIIDGALR